MFRINIICVDPLKENFNKEAQKEYLKRLSAYADVRINEVDAAYVSNESSQALVAGAMEKEGKQILKKLLPGAIVPMCVEGKQLSSEELADFFERTASSGTGTVNFIIGGSYGLSDEVKSKGTMKLSMSKMTLPHELARVVLLEQCYRAMSIIKGTKYHK